MLFFSKADVIMEKYAGTAHDFGKVRDMFRNSKANAEKIKETSNFILARNEEYREREKKYAKVANILGYMGFLCLFCTLIITSFVTIPNLLQQILTVISFTIILITQQINISTSERIAKENEESQEILKSQQESTESSEKLEKLFYEIIEEIEAKQENQEK